MGIFVKEDAMSSVANAAKGIVNSATKKFDEHFNKVQASAKHDIATLQLKINAVKTSADKIRVSTEINNNINVFKHLATNLNAMMQNDHNKSNTNYKRIRTWADTTLSKFEGLRDRLEKKVVSQ